MPFFRDSGPEWFTRGMRTLRFLCFAVAFGCFVVAAAVARRDPVLHARLVAVGLAAIALYLTVESARALD